MILFIVLERILNAIVTLFLRFFFGTGDSASDLTEEELRDYPALASPLKGYASIQMIGAGATYISTIGSSLLNILSSVASGALAYTFWAIVVTFFFSILYVIQEYYPDIMVQTVDSWNAWMGPLLHTLLIAPSKVFDIMFSAIIPIYNLITWVFIQWFYNGIILTAINDLRPYRDFGVNLALFCKEFVQSAVYYIETFVYPCPLSTTTTTQSSSPSSSTNTTSPASFSLAEITTLAGGDRCFDPGIRTFDFITPMKHIRGIAIAWAAIIANMCHGLKPVVDISIYPFIDINFSKGIQGIVNSILYTLIQVPSVTYQRCKRHGSGDPGGDSINRLVMCLPDFDPSYNMLISGLRSMGRMLDNWLDISSIIVQEFIGIDTGTDCEAQALALSPANYSRALFGTNETRVVGLTEGLYAVTDGYHAQYFNHYNSVETIIVPNAWPEPIDVSMGVAAVTYWDDHGAERDSLGFSSTTMLGCRCMDNAGAPPMRIRCVLALMEEQAYGDSISVEDDLAFDVVFHQRSTANYMTCKTSEISVQSVRWPSTRFTRAFASEADLRDTTCQSKGTCSRIDATIWVAPLCSSSSRQLLVQSACIPTFTGASCYP